jgi:hypothetical protein
MSNALRLVSRNDRNVTARDTNIDIVSPFLFGHFFYTVVITAAYTAKDRRCSLFENVHEWSPSHLPTIQFTFNHPQ